MFFCDSCAKKKNWPQGFVRSFGPCEICGKKADCSDVPSSALPKPKTDEVTSDFINEIVKCFDEGTPLILVVGADENELTTLRFMVIRALPVLAVRTVVTTARDYTWPEQNIKFSIQGDTLPKDYCTEASTFWTVKACKLAGIDPDTGEIPGIKERQLQPLLSV